MEVKRPPLAFKRRVARSLTTPELARVASRSGLGDVATRDRAVAAIDADDGITVAELLSGLPATRTREIFRTLGVEVGGSDLTTLSERLVEQDRGRSAGRHARGGRVEDGDYAPAPLFPPGFRFEVVETLSRGGFGVVRLARDRRTGQRVALKSLLRPNSSDHGLLAREFRLLAHVTDPNLVRLLELIEGPEGPMIVMEYLEGPSLNLVIDELRTDQGRALDIATQLAGVLSRLQGLGFVHGDVKPSNMHVLDGDRLVLVDFGCSTTLGKLPPLGGSPRYAPPEWSADLPPTAKWDVWGFGAVLHHLITGRAPDRPINLPRHPLTPLAERALAVDPDQRPSWNELSELLPGPSPALSRARAPLVGVSTLLRTLRAAVRTAAELPRVLILHGSSGAGKSAIAKEVMREAGSRSGARTAAVVCNAFDALPFRVLDPLAELLVAESELGVAEALGRFLPGLGGRLQVAASSSSARVDAVGALGRLLRQHPSALLVEDGHRGDVESAAVLAEVFASLADEGAGALLVVTQSSRESPFSRALQDGLMASATLVDLVEVPALEVEDAHRLLAHLGVPEGRRPPIVARASGNPLLLELLSEMEIPDLDPEAILRELTRGDVQRLALLTVLTVAGRPVSLGRLAETLDQSESQVFLSGVELRERRVASTWLEAGEPMLGLANERLVDLLSAALGEASMVDAHERLVATSPPDSEERARHLLGAGRISEGAEELRAAALAAGRRGAWPSAARLWERVREHRTLNPSELGDLAEMSSRAGRGRAAARVWRQLATREVDAERQLQLLRRAGASLLSAGVEGEGLEVMRDVLAKARVPIPRTLPGQAVRLIRAKRATRDLSVPEARGRLGFGERVALDALDDVATGLSLWRPLQSAIAQAELLRLALKSADRRYLCKAMCTQVIQQAGFEYDTEASERMASLLARLSAELGSQEGELYLEAGLAGRYWMEGVPGKAHHHAERALAKLDGLAHPTPWFRSSVHLLLVTNLAEVGRLDELRRILPYLLQDARDREDLHAESHLLVHGQAWIDRIEGRYERGLANLDRAMAPWRSLGTTLLSVFEGFQRVQLLIAADRLDEALAFFRALDRRTRWSPLMALDSHRSLRAVTEALLASALVDERGTRSDRRRLARARRALLSRPHPYTRVQNLALTSRSADGGRDVEPLLEAERIAAAHGAHLTALAARVRAGAPDGEDALRRLGARYPRQLARSLLA